MDDLSAMLNQILSNPAAMQQVQSMASSLGLGGTAPAPQPQAPAAPSGGLDLSALTALLQQPGPPSQPPPPPQQTPDLSQLAALLQQAMSQSAPPPPQQQTPDLSQLASILQQAMGQSAPPPLQQTPDLSQLLSMLGAGAQPAQAPPAPAGPNIDLNTLMKLSRAMSSLQANRANVDLLLALKPRLKDDRAKKVDDAIRVMQIVQFLPLVKESGLFGEMDNILGGIGNFIGNTGLGGLFGGGNSQSQGGGLSSLLGNLVRR